MCNFFFFQAEDGIRDGRVTGVQTCALPISDAPDFTVSGFVPDLAVASSTSGTKRNETAHGEVWRVRGRITVRGAISEIGRASCRERVSGAGAGGSSRTS